MITARDLIHPEPTQLDRIEAQNKEILALLTKKKVSNPDGITKSRLDGLRKAMVESSFERWWKVYPKKKSKRDALKAFTQAVRPMGASKASDFTDAIITDIKRRLNGDWSWIKEDGAYQPLAGTYIRGKRWEDEITPKPRPVAKNGATEIQTASHDRVDFNKLRSQEQLLDATDPYASLK